MLGGGVLFKFIEQNVQKKELFAHLTTLKVKRCTKAFMKVG
jgi:hypothetical protein